MMSRVARLQWLLCCLAGTAVVLPATASASSPELTGLERELGAMVAGRSSEYGIAALDLRDGSAVALNGNVPFPMASTVKLAIAAAYLAQVDQGHRNLDDVIAGHNAATLMDRMIVRSDNVAADQLLSAVGGPAGVQQWLASSGITGIRVDRTIAQLLREHGHLADVRT